MPYTSWRIEELDRLEAIEEVTRRYRLEYGGSPVNVSHWNTSREFKDRMSPLLDLNLATEPLDYLYSYYAEGRTDVITRTGFDPEQHYCLLTAASTISIVAVVHWLRTLRLDRVVIVGPCYFTVVHACRAFGIDVEVRYVTREDGIYRLPDLPKPAERAAVWITNPVYAASQYLQTADIERLSIYSRSGGMVVLDEALGLPSRTAGRHLQTENPFACIYSPHKAVSVNGFKFSAIIVRKADETFFEQWSDVLIGSLPASSVAALNHYLSPAFDAYAEAFLRETGQTLDWIRRREESAGVPTFDRDTSGNYATFFFPAIRADVGYDKTFLWEAARASGAVFIPAIRSYFNPALGLGLRVNLALDSPLFRGALLRLFATLRRFG